MTDERRSDEEAIKMVRMDTQSVNGWCQGTVVTKQLIDPAERGCVASIMDNECR